MSAFGGKADIDAISSGCLFPTHVGSRFARQVVVHKFRRQLGTENCQTAQVFCIAQIYVVAPPKRALFFF
jgi:hypothetical protein